MTIVSQRQNQKKVPNIKPLNRPNLGATPFTNVSFPFGKPYGPKTFGELNSRLVGYSPHQIKPPIPGEGLPRVINYCADQSGCAFWRLIWPGDELLAHNKAVIMTLYQMVLIGQFYGGIDAVRLQRQCTDAQIEFIKFLRNVSDQMKSQTGKGFRIIWEVDDIICPANDIPDYNICKSGFTDDKILRNLKEMVKYIDEMTVVSEYMKKHYQKHLGYDRISVIPNYAPKSWLDRGFNEKDILLKYKTNQKKKPRILYAGSGTHFDVHNVTGQKDDFGHVVDAIAKDILVTKKYEWVFFGAVPLKLKQFIGNGIEFHNWGSITDYPQKLKDLNVDISIAPLQANNFSRAKANIKLTEAGAQGIPCVAQNLECYNSDGWKYLFDTPEEMFTHIDAILANKTTYMNAVRFSREYSEKFFLQDHLDQYVKLFTTDYGDERRKENKAFVDNNPHQF